MSLPVPLRWVTTVLFGLVAAGVLFVGYRYYSRLQVAEAEVIAAPVAPLTQPEIIVHVTGAVQEPGLHRLPADARVGEAVAAARPESGAAPEALNLAAPLADGDKIFVPKQEELPVEGSPAAAMGANHTPVGGKSGSPSGAPNRKININTATEQELAQVPGIGPYLAGKIAAHRKAIGRYRRPEDLLNVPGIGEATLRRISPYLTV